MKENMPKTSPRSQYKKETREIKTHTSIPENRTLNKGSQSDAATQDLHMIKQKPESSWMIFVPIQRLFKQKIKTCNTDMKKKKN